MSEESDPAGAAMRQAEAELRAAQYVSHTLKDAHDHARAAQIALRDLNPITWAGMSRQAVDLAVAVLNQQTQQAREDVATCARVAAHHYSIVDGTGQ